MVVFGQHQLTFARNLRLRDKGSNRNLEKKILFYVYVGAILIQILEKNIYMKSFGFYLFI